MASESTAKKSSMRTVHQSASLAAVGQFQGGGGPQALQRGGGGSSRSVGAGVTSAAGGQGGIVGGHSTGGSSLAVRVLLLDDTVSTFYVPYKSTGRDLFAEVVHHLQLIESDYFDLEFADSAVCQSWLNHEKLLLRQVNSASQLFFKFSVKFYTPDPSLLEDEYTRYLYALQIKRDLATGSLPCNVNTAALLASYVTQAELGDWLEEYGADAAYLAGYRFVIHQTDDFLHKVAHYHQTHSGMSPKEADFHLLDTARKVDMYGVKLHTAKDHEDVALSLAVAHLGILVFQQLTKINTFSWARIRKLSFKRKKFLVKLHPDGYGYYKDTIEFFFETRDECKNFWKKCIEHHAFFRCDMVRRLPRSKSKIVSRGSSYRYSGRTQKQLIDYVRTNYVRRPQFDRAFSSSHVSGDDWETDESDERKQNGVSQSLDRFVDDWRQSQKRYVQCSDCRSASATSNRPTRLSGGGVGDAKSPANVKTNTSEQQPRSRLESGASNGVTGHPEYASPPRAISTPPSTTTPRQRPQQLLSPTDAAARPLTDKSFTRPAANESPQTDVDRLRALPPPPKTTQSQQMPTVTNASVTTTETKQTRAVSGSNDATAFAAMEETTTKLVTTEAMTSKRITTQVFSDDESELVISTPPLLQTKDGKNTVAVLLRRYDTEETSPPPPQMPQAMTQSIEVQQEFESRRLLDDGDGRIELSDGNVEDCLSTSACDERLTVRDESMRQPNYNNTHQTVADDKDDDVDKRRRLPTTTTSSGSRSPPTVVHSMPRNAQRDDAQLTDDVSDYFIPPPPPPTATTATSHPNADGTLTPTRQNRPSPASSSQRQKTNGSLIPNNSETDSETDTSRRRPLTNGPNEYNNNISHNSNDNHNYNPSSIVTPPHNNNNSYHRHVNHRHDNNRRLLSNGDGDDDDDNDDSHCCSPVLTDEVTPVYADQSPSHLVSPPSHSQASRQFVECPVAEKAVVCNSSHIASGSCNGVSVVTPLCHKHLIEQRNNRFPARAGAGGCNSNVVRPDQLSRSRYIPPSSSQSSQSPSRTQTGPTAAVATSHVDDFHDKNKVKNNIDDGGKNNSFYSPHQGEVYESGDRLGNGNSGRTFTNTQTMIVASELDNSYRLVCVPQQYVMRHNPEIVNQNDSINYHYHGNSYDGNHDHRDGDNVSDNNINSYCSEGGSDRMSPPLIVRDVSVNRKLMLPSKENDAEFFPDELIYVFNDDDTDDCCGDEIEQSRNVVYANAPNRGRTSPDDSLVNDDNDDKLRTMEGLTTDGQRISKHYFDVQPVPPPCHFNEAQKSTASSSNDDIECESDAVQVYQNVTMDSLQAFPNQSEGHPLCRHCGIAPNRQHHACMNGLSSKTSKEIAGEEREEGRWRTLGHNGIADYLIPPNDSVYDWDHTLDRVMRQTSSCNQPMTTNSKHTSMTCSCEGKTAFHATMNSNVIEAKSVEEMEVEAFRQRQKGPNGSQSPVYSLTDSEQFDLSDTMDESSPSRRDGPCNNETKYERCSIGAQTSPLIDSWNQIVSSKSKSITSVSMSTATASSTSQKKHSKKHSPATTSNDQFGHYQNRDIFRNANETTSDLGKQTQGTNESSQLTAVTSSLVSFPSSSGDTFKTSSSHRSPSDVLLRSIPPPPPPPPTLPQQSESPAESATRDSTQQRPRQRSSKGSELSPNYIDFYRETRQRVISKHIASTKKHEAIHTTDEEMLKNGAAVPIVSSDTASTATLLDVDIYDYEKRPPQQFNCEQDINTFGTAMIESDATIPRLEQLIKLPGCGQDPSSPSPKSLATLLPAYQSASQVHLPSSSGGKPSANVDTQYRTISSERDDTDNDGGRLTPRLRLCPRHGKVEKYRSRSKAQSSSSQTTATTTKTCHASQNVVVEPCASSDYSHISSMRSSLESSKNRKSRDDFQPPQCEPPLPPPPPARDQSLRSATSSKKDEALKTDEGLTYVLHRRHILNRQQQARNRPVKPSRGEHIYENYSHFSDSSHTSDNKADENREMRRGTEQASTSSSPRQRFLEANNYSVQYRRAVASELRRLLMGNAETLFSSEDITADVDFKQEVFDQIKTKLDYEKWLKNACDTGVLDVPIITIEAATPPPSLTAQSVKEDAKAILRAANEQLRLHEIREAKLRDAFGHPHQTKLQTSTPSTSATSFTPSRAPLTCPDSSDLDYMDDTDASGVVQGAPRTVIIANASKCGYGGRNSDSSSAGSKFTAKHRSSSSSEDAGRIEANRLAARRMSADSVEHQRCPEMQSCDADDDAEDDADEFNKRKDGGRASVDFFQNSETHIAMDSPDKRSTPVIHPLTEDEHMLASSDEDMNTKEDGDGGDDRLLRITSPNMDLSTINEETATNISDASSGNTLSAKHQPLLQQIIPRDANDDEMNDFAREYTKAIVDSVTTPTCDNSSSNSSPNDNKKMDDKPQNLRRIRPTVEFSVVESDVLHSPTERSPNSTNDCDRENSDDNGSGSVKPLPQEIIRTPRGIPLSHMQRHHQILSAQRAKFFCATSTSPAMSTLSPSESEGSFTPLQRLTSLNEEESDSDHNSGAGGATNH